jgi:hypothetical protein
MDFLVQLIQRIANLNDREAAVLGGEARGLEHITMLDTESTGPVDGCELTVPTLSSLIDFARHAIPPTSGVRNTMCVAKTGRGVPITGCGRVPTRFVASGTMAPR